VWMRGFPVPANWHATREQEAILIQETPWAADENAV
jgi:hypothetical protein